MTILASLILLCWIAQGLYMAARLASDGYSLLWVEITGIFALGLLLPLGLLWL